MRRVVLRPARQLAKQLGGVRLGNPYQYRGHGDEFVDDYSPLAGVASAVQGFSEAFDKAQDRQYKRVEQKAQLDALKTKMERDKFQDQLSAKKEGYAVGPSGELVEAELTPRQHEAQMLKEFEGGAKRVMGQDGKLSGYTADQNSIKFAHEKNQSALAHTRMDMMGDRLEETKNQNAIKAGHQIDEDPVMKDMQNARYSLSRGKALLDGKMPLTYHNLNAVQMDVINGMTKGGASSEGKVNREMQESWIGNWNNLMSKMGQYGPDVDIRKQDPGLYKQVQGLLNEVDGTIGKNMADRFGTLSSSYGQTTNQKVKRTIDDKRKQYLPPDEQQGLVPGGLVKPGLVSGAPATAPAQAHPEAGAAKAWANGVLSDKKSTPEQIAKAQEVLKRLGQ